MAFEQRMDIMLTYWHWLEYDSVALAVLFTRMHRPRDADRVEHANSPH
jgi:hypothetical protein